jgi:hypothetical protein
MPIPLWPQYADHPLAPKCRSRCGLNMPIIRWLLNADHALAPICRSVTWAWWCGFLLFGLSVCWSWVAMSTRADVGTPVGIKVIFAIFSCVVVGIWGRWWYAAETFLMELGRAYENLRTIQRPDGLIA